MVIDARSLAATWQARQKGYIGFGGTAAPPTSGGAPPTSAAPAPTDGTTHPLEQGPGYIHPVPSTVVGRVIGPGGVQIREIRDKTGARVRVGNDKIPGTNDRPLTIWGNDTQITQVLQMVTEICARPDDRPQRPSHRQQVNSAPPPPSPYGYPPPYGGPPHGYAPPPSYHASAYPGYGAPPSGYPGYGAPPSAPPSAPPPSAYNPYAPPSAYGGAPPPGYPPHQPEAGTAAPAPAYDYSAYGYAPPSGYEAAAPAPAPDAAAYGYGYPPSAYAPPPGYPPPPQ